MSPIRTFIKRPIFTAMLMMSVVVFGIFSYPKIGVDEMPSVEFPYVTVTTVLPGADPESIENNVSKPLEEALNTINGLEQLKSINYENASVVVMRFVLEKDVDIAAQDVRDQVQATLSKLPSEIQTPVVQKLDINALPILSLAVSGPQPVQELTRITEDIVKPALQRINGVGKVDILGGQKREIHIVVDPDRLRAYGLAVTDVSQTIQAQSVDLPGGRTNEPTMERVVKLEGQAQSVDEIRRLVVAAPNGAPVRISDVATVVDGPAEARSSAAFNGRPSVALQVTKQSGANTVEVADHVKEGLAEITSQLPEGARVELVSDNARFIKASIEGVKEDLVLGGILAVLIVLVFLRNLRSTMVSAVALPTSVIGTFAVMHYLGFTFNTVTMMALTLSIGLLIDDAIVVIENIVRHIEEGMPPMEAALKGTTQIAVAVLAVTLSVMAVFVPVAFMQGMVGKFFYSFGITVAAAVAISYFVSMTLTPMFSSLVLSHHQGMGKVGAALERAFTAVERFYHRILGWSLGHRKWVIVGAIAVFVLTIGLGKFLRTAFIPDTDRGLFLVKIELPQGSSLATTQRELASIEKQVAQIPGVVSFLSTAGGGVAEEVNKGQVLVNLSPVKERDYTQTQLMQHLRETLVVRKDALFSVSNYSAMAGGRAELVQFNLRGDNWPEVLAAVEKTKQAMLANPGLVDIDTSYRVGKPQLNVALDRERAANLGVPAAMVGGTIRAFLGADDFAKYREGGEDYDIRLKLPPEVLADPEAIGRLTLRNPRGQIVELRNLADVNPGEGPSQIDRESLKRQVTLYANLREGYSLGQALGFLETFGREELPKSVIHAFEGQGKELGNTMVAFVQALLLGVILVYMILAAQFESLVDPFTIMLALPLAMIGAIGGLLIANLELSMMAMIGIIMLMGLVTKNGILLVDFTNQLRQAGRPTHDALLEAGPIRLRPILMTTVAMIAGMVPVALARGDGAEMRAPMAIAIMGGLVTSTVLTLVVVPVVYSVLDGLRTRVMKRFRKKDLHAVPEDLAA